MPLPWIPRRMSSLSLRGMHVVRLLWSPANLLALFRNELDTLVQVQFICALPDRDPALSTGRPPSPHVIELPVNERLYANNVGMLDCSENLRLLGPLASLFLKTPARTEMWIMNWSEKRLLLVRRFLLDCCSTC